MAIKFQKAKREKIYVKCLLAGPSGSGKSYTALRMATGMAQEDGSRVAVIDTENGRIRYYANEFDFDDLQLQDFRPESYIEAIEAAVDGGYHVIVIDGITPEWDWCNATHDAMSGNSFTNWGKITPRHEKFMNKMLECPAHIIATVRGKDSYVLEENGGKQQPKKVGMGYQARGNTEYSFSATWMLRQDTHVAEIQKDNTHLFEGRYDVLTEKDGQKLYHWANDGETAPPRSVVTAADTAPEGDILNDLIEQIDATAKELPTIGVDRSVIAATVKDLTGGIVNYKNIKDAAVAKRVLAALTKMKEDK